MAVSTVKIASNQKTDTALRNQLFEDANLKLIQLKNKLEIDQAPSVSQVFQGLILKGVKHQVELNITGKP